MPELLSFTTGISNRSYQNMKVFYDKDCRSEPDQGQDRRHHRLRLARPRPRPKPERQRREGRGRSAQGRRFLGQGRQGWPDRDGSRTMQSRLLTLVMILLPDEQHRRGATTTTSAPNIKQGASLAFAHGFNVHYNQVVPRADLDVMDGRPQGSGPHRALHVHPRWRRAPLDRCVPGQVRQGP